IKCAGSEEERFDHVVIATHSDQALAMLTDPSAAEREILGALPYQVNETVLHTDDSFLPRTRRAWASWNYHRLHEEQTQVAITYNTNKLQSSLAPETFCVTLNRTAATTPAKSMQKSTYDLSLYTVAGLAARKPHRENSGVNSTYGGGA